MSEARESRSSNKLAEKHYCRKSDKKQQLIISGQQATTKKHNYGTGI